MLTFLFCSCSQVVDTCLRKVLIDRDVQGAIAYSKQVRSDSRTYFRARQRFR